MKKIILSAAILFTLAACNNAEKKDESTVTQSTDSVATAVNKPAATPKDSLSYTFTDKAGEKLNINFDNEADVAVVNFKGETMTLKGQVTASGILYTNEHFAYEEHQGNIEFKKDGKIVFKGSTSN